MECYPIVWQGPRFRGELLNGIGLEDFGTVAHGEKVGEQSELLDR